MKTAQYRVPIKYTTWSEVYVEAKDRDEAEDKALADDWIKEIIGETSGFELTGSARLEGEEDNLVLNQHKEKP